MKIEAFLIFLLLSIPVIFISLRTIFYPGSHGFYRFLSWECILWLLANNYSFWFTDPFSLKQIVSWLMLIYSIYPLISGIVLLKKAGKSDNWRKEEELFDFEKTTELIETGIFKYIRRPLYSSLLFLSWGTYFKNTDMNLFIVAVASSVFLYLTARMDEKECKVYFGEKYNDYIIRSKMFIPFLF